MKNYHTHTYRCKHAEGTDEEYVLAAIKADFTTLGFSDHTPWHHEGRWRMPKEELAGYCLSIRDLQEKYKDQIDIFLGLECEGLTNELQWLREIKLRYNIDYLILGNHFTRINDQEIFYDNMPKTDETLELYCNTSIKALESGLFSCFAHPDWFASCKNSWDKKCDEVARRICICCKEHDVPLEYNLGGIRRNKAYPNHEFWKIAKEYDCKAIIGVDAHSPKHLLDISIFEIAKNNLKNLGITPIEGLSYPKNQK